VIVKRGEGKETGFPCMQMGIEKEEEKRAMITGFLGKLLGI
jgi:hypothetical protein